jgi:LacI family transcriptional regulator
VFGGRPFNPELHDNYFVDVDNAAGAALATQYLIDLGRRRIATITGPTNMQAPLDRTRGWSETLERAGLPTDLVANGDFTMISGARAMRELLVQEPAVDAVFVASDLMAVGAVSVLREQGLDIPGDVAVVGFDDSPAALSGGIQLTTVHQPSAEMGRRMAELMLSLLRGESPERKNFMPTRIVVRDSA